MGGAWDWEASFPKDGGLWVLHGAGKRHSPRTEGEKSGIPRERGRFKAQLVK